MTRDGFGIYVHWPFCRSKCPYCDFNSHVRERHDEEAWRGALLAELDHYAARTPGRTVTSVFFGGGTPSLMEPASAGAVLERIALRWAVPGDVEITLEANPNSAEAARFAAFRAAGINRLSIGVQALDDQALRFLGRGHDAGEARAAIAAASRVFDRYSFDLIYARPGQTLAGWEAELRQALGLASDHLSVYQLTSSRAPHSMRRVNAGISPCPISISPPISSRRRMRSSGAPVCRSTKSPTTRGRGGNAGTTSSTGAMRTMSGPAPVRTGV